MIFIINAQGTTKGVLYEPVYQGSNGANQIILVAPFAQNVSPTVAFTLPNGIQTEPLLMTPFQDTTGEILYDADKNAYNIWSADIEYPITEFAGVVDVQFTLYLGSRKVLGTYTSAFEVGKGVPTSLPEVPSIDVYEQILDYLSSINADTNEAVSKAISYIRYIAPEDKLTPADVTATGGTHKGTFTVEGMTEYLDESNLSNPNAVGNRDELFYQNTENTKPDPVGFVIDLGEEKDVGLVQAYYFQIAWESTVKCYVSLDNSVYTLTDTKVLNPGSFLEIYQFKVNQQARYIKLVQEDGANQNTNGSFSYKGVEIYQENINGQYEIVRENGNISYIDTYDAANLVNIVTGLKDDTGDYKDQAQEYAENTQALFDNANKVGGVPLLVDIEGEPKIPSVFINLTNINNYSTITDISQLDTIPALVGDVARLVVDVDGESGNLEVIKSYVLLSIENGQRTWALYGTSYADNAGNAEFAKTSYDSMAINGQTIGVYTEQEFNTLSSFPNISFVGI